MGGREGGGGGGGGEGPLLLPTYGQFGDLVNFYPQIIADLNFIYLFYLF